MTNLTVNPEVVTEFFDEMVRVGKDPNYSICTAAVIIVVEAQNALTLVNGHQINLMKGMTVAYGIGTPGGMDQLSYRGYEIIPQDDDRVQEYTGPFYVEIVKGKGLMQFSSLPEAVETVDAVLKHEDDHKRTLELFTRPDRRDLMLDIPEKPPAKSIKTGLTDLRTVPINEVNMTKEQVASLYDRWKAIKDTERKTFGEFLATVQPTFGCDDAVTVQWCGMWLCIEKDGYCHS